MSDEMNNKEKIEKWLAGTLNEDDLASFQQSDAGKDLVRLDAALKRFKPADFDAEVAYQKLQSRKEKSAKVIQGNFAWTTFMQVAAVLVMGLGIIYVINLNLSKSEIKTFATTAGKTLKVSLPDASVVTLNALSSLSYDAGKWNNERSLVLEGEGFFQVTKGRTFQVKTKSGSVTVLGTEFNVKERSGFYEVSCHEGKVEVRSSGKVTQLTAQQAYREVNKISSNPVLALEATPSWLRNESSFENVPFSEVLAELERQYDVTVKTDAIDLNLKFSGKFPNNDLSTALKSMALPLRLKYEVQDKFVLLTNGD